MKKLNEKRINELSQFCKKARISFKDYEILDHAFYHRSVSNELHSKNNPFIYNNERLEFLGDSVLGMVTAKYLFQSLSKTKEGDLSKIKSVVVSEKILAPIAVRLGLDKLLVLGHGEEITGGRSKPAILADCMEAVIGAYFIDSGFDSVEKYILSFIIPEINTVLLNGTKDYKTQLQEEVQKKLKATPVYKLISETGPEHQKNFTVAVYLGNKEAARASGLNKKEAEQNCAKIALTNF
ncbi:MAG: ribonuclease III [Treponema sp.]|nr:ribonuclease III [Treponema sp.]